ncbi:hypothetical protein ACFWQC_14295 [Nocardioides sp. NPDC058538]|uniref:hypothetical protein n=1 Tax=Nocardioides sp. NPDC058538 TaxID=3346542 RepID=UPI00365288C4
MGSERARSADLDVTPEAAFQAALGVAQHEKKYEIRAVHNEGQALIIRQKTKALSWPKVIMLRVHQKGSGSSVNVLVQNIPGGPTALLDGVFNGKIAEKYLGGIQGTLDGTVTAPATPVASHYVRDDGSELPWGDPDELPEF